MRYLITFMLVLILHLTGFATTYHVPDDFRTIQAAIDASVDGDVVIVKPGTYVERIDFQGKAITVRSSGGPEATTIDGDYCNSAVVSFINGESMDSILEGFTVTKGYYGGILCRNASPSILNNYITQNVANDDGSGIHCDSASPLINGNKIYNNMVEFDDGGGIYCYQSAPTIENNIISRNYVGNHSSSNSGIEYYNSTPCIVNNIIEKNEGCGIKGWISNSSAFMISGNRICGNKSSGISCGLSSPEIKNNRIHENQSAGITCNSASPAISNNVIYKNSGVYGGGIYCEGSYPIIMCNTIYENSASGEGGGICCLAHSWPIVGSTILWNNEAPKGPEIYIGLATNPAMLDIDYSDVKGGLASVFVEKDCHLYWGAGMIDGRPLFVDAAKGDFHIQFDSQCRNGSLLYSIHYDFESDPRHHPGMVGIDIGADEFHDHLYYTGDATPGGHVEEKIIGYPDAHPVVLWIGSGVLEEPLATNFGSWHLEPPLLQVILGPIPANGVLVLPATLPSSLPAPYDIPSQALVVDNLTNLSIMEVR